MMETEGHMGARERPAEGRVKGFLRRHLALRSREQGAALVSVVVVIAVMSVTTADFAFNTTVDLVSAANARDDLRAHYLARSGVNLAQLLFKVQQRVIDPARKMLGGLDLQIADYAPILVSAFNSQEGAEMLGSLFGISGGEIKGLGVDVGTFDLKMDSLDGRLNLNCAGGANPSSPSVVRFASSLTALMMPPKYNKLFEDPDDKGQYADRLEVLRAIIDWVDQDLVMFGATAGEDYRYNAGTDPYENKNQYYDTLDELYLVKAIDEDFMNAFGEQLTVYGDCKVNVNIASAPLILALIVHFANDPKDPGLEWENLLMLARYVVHIRTFFGGFKDVQAFKQAVDEPRKLAVQAFSMGMQALGSSSESGSESSAGQAQYEQALPHVNGVNLKLDSLTEAVTVGGPRRIWRIVASAEVGRIKKKISAIWDMKLISMNRTQTSAGPGGFLYWREE